MVYLERLEHIDEDTLGSIAWHREKQVKHYSKERKRAIINGNRQRTIKLMNEWHKKNNKKNNSHVRRSNNYEVWTID